MKWSAKNLKKRAEIKFTTAQFKTKLGMPMVVKFNNNKIRRQQQQQDRQQMLLPRRHLKGKALTGDLKIKNV